MEKHIDLTTEIVTRLDSLGYPCIGSSSDYMIVANFLASNLTKLLGNYILSEDDVELIRSKHFMSINSSFYPTPIILEVNRTDDEIRLSGLTGEEGEELFNITKKGEVVVNNFYDKENSIIHSYEVDGFEDTKFTYTKTVVSEEEENVVFKAYLRGLGAKYRDREVFELTRVIPPEYKEQSLLKRIVDGIKGDNFISITTSVQTFETLMYTDVIFNRLEIEARKNEQVVPEQGPVLQKK